MGRCIALSKNFVNSNSVLPKYFNMGVNIGDIRVGYIPKILPMRHIRTQKYGTQPSNNIPVKVVAICGMFYITLIIFKNHIIKPITKVGIHIL